jgi:hypothetical protein
MFLVLQYCNASSEQTMRNRNFALKESVALNEYLQGQVEKSQSQNSVDANLASIAANPPLLIA